MNVNEQIKTAIETGANELTIEDHNIIVLPNEVWQMSNLTSLEIRNCYKLESLPAEICLLANLQFFKISRSKISSFPSEFWHLINLTTLEIFACPCLETIPSEIRLLSNLKSLQITGCEYLKDLPAEIGELILPNLSIVNFDYCRFFEKDFPSNNPENIKEVVIEVINDTHDTVALFFRTGLMMAGLKAASPEEYCAYYDQFCEDYSNWDVAGLKSRSQSPEEQEADYLKTLQGLQWDPHLFMKFKARNYSVLLMCLCRLAYPYYCQVDRIKETVLRIGGMVEIEEFSKLGDFKVLKKAFELGLIKSHHLIEILFQYGWIYTHPEYWLNAENINECLRYAVLENESEVLKYLLDYKHKHFPVDLSISFVPPPPFVRNGGVRLSLTAEHTPPESEYITNLLAALESARLRKDQMSEGIYLRKLGIACYLFNDVPKAIEFYKQTLSVFREIGDRSCKYYRFNSLGGFQFYLIHDSPEIAIGFYEQALFIAGEIGDHRAEGAALVDLGTAYFDFDDPQKANEVYEQALSIFRYIGDHPHSENYFNRPRGAFSDPHEALEFHEQALLIVSENHDISYKDEALHNLGLTHLFLGNYHEAITFCIQGRPENDFRVWGKKLYNRSFAFECLDEKEKNELVILSTDYDPDMSRAAELAILGNLGEAYKSLGEYQKAIETYEQRVQINRKILPNANIEGNTFSNLGLIYESLGEKQKAIHHFAQALKVYEDVKSPNSQKIRTKLDFLRT